MLPASGRSIPCRSRNELHERCELRAHAETGARALRLRAMTARPRKSLGPALVALVLCAGGVTWWLRRDRGADFTPPPVRGGWVEDVPGLWTLAPGVGAPGTGAGGIESLGYAEGYEPAPAELGVTVHEPASTHPGLNLYSSGHGPEAILMDMQGEVLHSWRLPHADIPDAPPLDDHHQDTLRRVRMLDDGSLLAIYGGRGLVKVDRDSKLLWHYPERVHHDLHVDERGHIWTLTRKERLLERVNPRRGVIDDFVVELSPEGVELRALSVMECLLASRWADRLIHLERREGDLMHTNSIVLLDDRLAERHPAFAAGNLLLCARDMDLLLVIDPRTRRVVWILEGPWLAPHDARPLDNGNLLLFDNLGHEGASRVLELDPVDGSIAWQYAPDPPEDLFTLFCGTSARLPNGNTLITETGGGRALEVTRDGTLVWEFVSPHRAGRQNALIAALFEVERLPLGAAAWME